MADTSAVEKEVADSGAEALGLIVDVSDQAATERMASMTADRFGQIHVLVNNAAFFKKATKGPFSNLSVDEWDRAFTVNVRGAWLCVRAVYPYMRAQGYGKVINISSTTFQKGVTGLPHYVSSKAALIGLTRALAREVGDDGIRVNTLIPDLIPDDTMLALNPGRNDEVVAARCLKRTETPEDMAGALVFLAGPGSDFMTGQSIVVDGGNVLH
jgi:NAD(P)-dependent dehydrogenase (short-subunit alcohol dehydrogenase family)